MSKNVYKYTGTPKFLQVNDGTNPFVTLNLKGHKGILPGHWIIGPLKKADYEKGIFETEMNVYIGEDKCQQSTSTQETGYTPSQPAKTTEIITKGSLSPYEELEKKVESLKAQIHYLQQTIASVRDNCR